MRVRSESVRLPFQIPGEEKLVRVKFVEGRVIFIQFISDEVGLVMSNRKEEFRVVLTLEGETLAVQEETVAEA